MALPSPSSQWYSLNPLTRPLTLSVLELTPLALTLSLTLASESISPALQPHLTPTQHVAHGHTHVHGSSRHRKKARQRRAESDDEATAVEADDEHTSSPLPGSYPLTTLLGQDTNFKDLLANGVVVCVNGQPWSRIVAHVSDPDDETPEAEAVDEEGDWEDDLDLAGKADGEIEEGLLSGSSVARRRPRKARFTLSASDAVPSAKEARRKRRPSEGTMRERQKLDKDQAVVVVYGLSAGKEYEIELQVLGISGQDGLDALAVSNSVLIPPSTSPSTGLRPRSRANSLRSRSRPPSRSNSINGPHPSHSPVSSPLSHIAGTETFIPSPDRVTPPTNGTTEAHSNPIPTNILNPIDTQAAHIRHMIATAHAEKDHLHSQIKEARRTSQRAEAALRVEIETVKRAIDKAGSMDLRARQKTLALQEQVKQAWAGAEHAEKETTTVEDSLSELESRLEAAKLDLKSAEDEWKDVKEKEEDIRDRENKIRGDEERKLADVVGKIEKLNAKKEKKQAEKADLEKRLQELERQHEGVEKRNEEERVAKRSSAYWWDPYVHGVQGHGQGHHQSHGHGHDQGRSLSVHPSLSNLSAHNQAYAAGRAYQPRGAIGHQPRFPSAGAVQPSLSQPNPTHPTSFHPLQHPVAAAAASPTLRPPKTSITSVSHRAISSSGVNVSAMPFHPSAGFQAQNTDHQHTTLMPPQLQHRIYTPNVRPRPAPNFNPPPSVLADQAQRQSPTMLSAPSFPPLPSHITSSGTPGKLVAPGPSLASIVTRAVLSPTSTLASQTWTGTASNNGTKPSPPPGGGLRSPTYAHMPSSPTVPSSGHSHTSSPTPTHHYPHAGPHSSHSGSTPSSRQGTFVQESQDDFPPLSPTGPWGTSSPQSGQVGFGMQRTSSPPVMGWGQGRHSPANAGEVGEQDRKGTD